MVVVSQGLCFIGPLCHRVRVRVRVRVGVRVRVRVRVRLRRSTNKVYKLS